MATNVPVQTVRTDGFSMDYIAFGHGKEPLVILPGLSVQSVLGQADAVAEAYRPLTEAFTIWLFDRRSDPPPSYSVCDMAEDTAAAVAALGLSHFSLFGVSQGGMMAMILAARHPGAVKKLALGSTAAHMTSGNFRIVREWVRLAKAGRTEDLYLAFGEALYPPQVLEASRELLLSAAKTVTEEDLRRFVILAEGLCGFDARDLLPRIACPTLILGDTDDRIVGAEASREIAGALRDASLFLYSGYGHAAYDTAPDYKERLLRFLTRDQKEI